VRLRDIMSSPGIRVLVPGIKKERCSTSCRGLYWPGLTLNPRFKWIPPAQRKSVSVIPTEAALR